MKINFSNHISPFLILGTIAIIGFGYTGFQYFLAVKEATKLSFEKIEFERKIKILERELTIAEKDNEKLSELFQEELERNNAFERQIRSISSTVGILEKLSQTDKELLQKYSKVYFLNENYVPSELTEIDEKYLYNKDRKSFIHAKVQKYLYQLMEDANFNDAPLLIISAYRSFGEQEVLKTGYLVQYGSGANRFSADQGYSEHQLGTSVDFTTPKLGADFTKIESEPAYEWLSENAHRYGFILSYPKENAYYEFEPWHWRFVGVNLAGELKRRKQNFYDMDQREIDTYLVSIFD